MPFRVDKTVNESGTTFFMLFVRDDYNWLDNFETFLDVLVHDCGCTVISDEFIVYIREAILEKNGHRFSFFHDSLDGGYICTQDDEAVTTLETVANDVISELKKRAMEVLSQESAERETALINE
jgi:hypothetical protein